MIRAVLWQDGTGRLTGYRLRGHAGYAEEGADIVCAAASVLAITCLNSLESVCGIAAEVRGGEDGRLEVRLPRGLSAERDHDAQVLLGGLRQGLGDLAGEYPQYIRFSILNGGTHHDEA